MHAEFDCYLDRSLRIIGDSGDRSFKFIDRCQARSTD